MKMQLSKKIKVLMFKDAEDAIVCTFNENTVMNITKDDFLKKNIDVDKVNIVDVFKLIDDMSEKPTMSMTDRILKMLYSFKIKNYKIEEILFADTIELKDIIKKINDYGLGDLKRIINIIEE